VRRAGSRGIRRRERIPPGRSLLDDSKKYKALGSLVKEIKAIS